MFLSIRRRLRNHPRSENIVTNKTVIGHVNFSDANSPYPFALMQPQSETERLLEEHLCRLGINTQRQTELSSFEQDESGIRQS
jgi:hypothetical protein